MPGISDARALTSAIFDSISPSDATTARLTSRNVRDITSAEKLRAYEANQLLTDCPEIYMEVLEDSKNSILNHFTGNHFVYQFMLFVINLMEDQRFLKTMRDPEVVRMFDVLASLMIAKMPIEQNNRAVERIPEGYGEAQAIYISLRSLFNKMMTLLSRSGSSRGKMQSISTHSKQEGEFEEKMAEFRKEFDEKSKTKSQPSPGVFIMTFMRGMKMRMVRLSDLIHLTITYKNHRLPLLFTMNHYDRATYFLNQYSNITMGMVLGYGMDGSSLGNDVAKSASAMIRELVKIGSIDDLSPGEAGKAVTDMYKARLSQTEELPWNNLSMLKKTYSDARRDNSEYLHEMFLEFGFDKDVMFNLSYVWKCCLQPDSNIRQDFIDLTKGLSEPNKISPDAMEQIELGFRRSLLVGALREHRQVKVYPDEGVTPHNILMRAVETSLTSDADLRSITYGMMKGIKIRIPNIFPDVYDTSHLSFKDKSSSIEDPAIREEIKNRSHIQHEIIELEDKLALMHAKERADDFFRKVSPELNKKKIKAGLRTTANDILSSLDERVSDIFKEADYKFKEIIKSMRGISKNYGEPFFMDELLEWARDNPGLLINTATEPKLGEVHKRTVRIFYMFEKGMKTFLSQFERMSRIMDRYIKGAEIVKGDRAREKHMNILSSAHKAVHNGVLAYQILFDLSKFSQKFNHGIIDSAAKVIGEATNYPHYGSISSLFKAAFLYVSSRNVDESFVGVLGAFEGFLNFLWTGIHATVMDIALKNCGRSGDLAAYSDDGLLMFTMESSLGDDKGKIQDELNSVIGSITSTYKDFGLDFNLGKTLISRNLSEFLGVVQYKGKRMPTWVKELASLGKEDENKMIKSLAQEITDISSQTSAMIKAGMPPYAATYVGYLEILLGPARKILSSAKGKAAFLKMPVTDRVAEVVTCVFLCLNGAFGGVRLPDQLSFMTTADTDPISEMLQDLRQLEKVFPEVRRIYKYISDNIEPTRDYTKLFLGASPVNTTDISYGSSVVRDAVLKRLKHVFPEIGDHPLSRKRVRALHEVLEDCNNIFLPTITSLARYVIEVIEYDRLLAPTKASSVAKLLEKPKVMSVQSADTRAYKKVISRLVKCLSEDDECNCPEAKELYIRSFPKLTFSNPVPSYRSLSSLVKRPTNSSYQFRYTQLPRTDEKGTYRLLNLEYTDEMVPPLITSDVNIKHLTSAPDLSTHCLRSLYSEIVSACSQGHDILLVANEICKINKIPMLPMSILSTLHDMRKIAVANRKKSIHRVYWSMPTKAAGTLLRQGQLNTIMTQTRDLHYSLIVTVALAQTHLAMTTARSVKSKESLYIHFDPERVMQTRLLPMTHKELTESTDVRREVLRKLNFEWDIVSQAYQSIIGEVERAIQDTTLEIRDNLITGRMGMFSDIRALAPTDAVSDPLRYALVWSLVAKLHSVSQAHSGTAGVESANLEVYSYESVPPYLASLSMIWQAYSQMHKSELNTYMKKGRENKQPFLPESIASDTLYSASDLGLVHNLTLESLRSFETTETYNAMLIAADLMLVYYAADVNAESVTAETVSQARAKAVKRVIDSLITRMFLSKIHNGETDAYKLNLMILGGCARGSVHRKEPYNPRVVRSWILYINCMIEEFLDRLGDEWKKEIVVKGKRKFKEFDKELIASLTEFMYTGECSVKRPNLGNINSFDQAIKFIANLGKWGFLPRLVLANEYCLADDFYKYLHNRWVNPALHFVRTISYSTLEDILKHSPLENKLLRESSDKLSEMVDEMLESIPDDMPYNDLMYQTPKRFFRESLGEFDEYEFNLKAHDLHPDYIPTLLAYSISLPMMLAMGKSSLGKIVDVRNSAINLSSSPAEMFISEYSLPMQGTSTSVNLVIFRRMSERELIRNISTWCHSSDERTKSLVCVELPPLASLVSIGLTKWLTSEKFSYITPNISSDYKGVSLYVVSYITPKFPDFETNMNIRNDFRFNLGLGSFSKLIDPILDGRHDIVASLILTPMLQAGLPIGGDVLYKGMEINVDTVEELVDKAQVSFIQASKPSDMMMTLSRLDPTLMMHLVRAIQYKHAESNTPIYAIAAGAHYYHSMFPQFPVSYLIEVFIEAVFSFKSVPEQKDAILRIYDPVMTLQSIDLSALPIGVQIGEVSLPKDILPEVRYRKKLDDEIRPLLRISGFSALPKEERGSIISFLRSSTEIIDVDQLINLLTCPDDEEEVVFSGELKIPAQHNELEEYAKAAVLAKPVHISSRSEEAKRAVHDLRLSIESVFAIPPAGTSNANETSSSQPVEETADTYIEIIIEKIKTIGGDLSNLEFLSDWELELLRELSTQTKYEILEQLDMIREELRSQPGFTGGVI